MERGIAYKLKIIHKQNYSAEMAEEANYNMIDTVVIKNVKKLWKQGKPRANEFKEYLTNPVSISPFTNTLKKKWIPVPVMDEKDYGIFLKNMCSRTTQLQMQQKTQKKKEK